jgi:hypothetical protein
VQSSRLPYGGGAGPSLRAAHILEERTRFGGRALRMTIEDTRAVQDRTPFDSTFSSSHCRERMYLYLEDILGVSGCGATVSAAPFRALMKPEALASRYKEPTQLTASVRLIVWAT